MRLVRGLLVLVAFAAAIVPLPAALVERSYSRTVYPAIQTALTPLTNGVPIALADAGVLVLLVVAVVVVRRRARRERFMSVVASSLVSGFTLAAVGYLLFLLLWGLNYRRVPLEQKIDFDASRVTTAAARRLGEQAVRMVNGLHAASRGAAGDGPSLATAFATAQQALGSTRLAVPGVPKRSLLQLYFRSAAIDGMTDPFFLEIILNPDTLPFERPFVTAHEWAHLAGYAHEAEANFVAWLACLQGDAMARYSAWLAVYEHVWASLPRADRAQIASALGPGPRQDLDMMAARYARSSPIVRDTARDVYDSYLRANRVEEGIASYSAIVRLILGAGLEEGQLPRPKK